VITNVITTEKVKAVFYHSNYRYASLNDRDTFWEMRC